MSDWKLPEDLQRSGPGGTEPVFHAVSVFEGGVTQAVLVDFGGAWTLEPRNRFEMLKIAYELSGPGVRLVRFPSIRLWRRNCTDMPIRVAASCSVTISPEA